MRLSPASSAYTYAALTSGPRTVTQKSFKPLVIPLSSPSPESQPEHPSTETPLVKPRKRQVGGLPANKEMQRSAQPLCHLHCTLMYSLGAAQMA